MSGDVAKPLDFSRALNESMPHRVAQHILHAPRAARPLPAAESRLRPACVEEHLGLLTCQMQIQVWQVDPRRPGESVTVRTRWTYPGSRAEPLFLRNAVADPAVRAERHQGQAPQRRRVSHIDCQPRAIRARDVVARRQNCRVILLHNVPGYRLHDPIRSLAAEILWPVRTIRGPGQPRIRSLKPPVVASSWVLGSSTASLFRSTIKWRNSECRSSYRGSNTIPCNPTDPSATASAMPR